MTREPDCSYRLILTLAHLKPVLEPGELQILVGPSANPRGLLAIQRVALPGCSTFEHPGVEEIDAWRRHRNKHHANADWQFTTADARIKLKHLYPSI